MDFLTLLVPALIGSAAWIYQRAWERQETRRQSYATILSLLPSFMARTHDADGIRRALSEFRSMLLFAPDEVIRAAEKFARAVQDGSSVSDDERYDRLNDLVMAMRRDCTFWSSIWPHMWGTKITQTALLNLDATRTKNEEP